LDADGAHLAVETVVSNPGLLLTPGIRGDRLENEALDVSGETNVDPEVFPIVLRDKCSNPMLSHVVHDNKCLGSCGSHGVSILVGKAGVWHAAHGENGRQNHHLIEAPGVVNSDERLNDVKEDLKVGSSGRSRTPQLHRIGANLRLANDVGRISTELGDNLVSLEVTDDSGHQVVGSWHGVVEARLVVSVERLVNTGGVAAHVDTQVVVRGDAATPADTVRWSVLLRSDHSAEDVH